MISTVIFDLDGLLVDSEVTWYQVFKNILADYGHEFPLETYVKKFSGKTIVDNIAQLIEGYQVDFGQEAGVERAIRDEANFVEQGIALKAGAVELLRYLKDNQYKVVLGTSSTRERAMKILKHNGIDQYFDDIVVGYEVERSKPFPDVFLAAAAKVGAEPEECLVLEDSEAGIQAAFAAEIPVICIPDLKKPGEEHAAKTVAILPSLDEVIDYLKAQKEIKKGDNTMTMKETLFSRKSIRSYTGDAISAAELKEILKAAYAAPVGRAQYDTLTLTVITNKELLAQIDENCAQQFGNPSMHPLYGAPTFILVSGQLTGTPHDNVAYSNAAIIVHNMALAAVELGIGACHIWGASMMLNVNPELVKELNLPEGYTPCCGIILGKTDEKYEMREIPERIKTMYLD